MLEGVALIGALLLALDRRIEGGARALSAAWLRVYPRAAARRRAGALARGPASSGITIV